MEKVTSSVFSNLSLRVKVNILIAAVFLLVTGGQIILSHTEEKERVVGLTEKHAKSLTFSYFDGLNTLMLTGGMDERGILREKMLKKEGVLDARVLRGEPVNREYGAGLPEEAPQDDLDRRALQGEDIMEGEDGENGRSVVVITPFAATSNTDGVDCLGCHNVPSGSINGAVRVNYSLKEIDSELRHDLWMGIGISLLLFTLGLICINLILSKIAFDPLDRLNDRLKDMAEGEGDLTVRLLEQSKDEMGQIAHWFNVFITKIDNTVRAISSNSQTLAGAAEELTAVSQQMGANAEETSAQAGVVAEASGTINTNVQTVASGIEELSASSREIANNTAEAAKVATMGVELATEASDSISKLEVSSAEIGEIVNAINSIAEQTKLLALNATIEAARAGEAGKGFAVVAKEVKDLAMETAKASDDIGLKIEDIQGNTMGAVEVISRINEMIGKVNEYQTTIASSVDEQTATANEIASNVADAAHGSSDVAQSIAGVAETAHNTSTGVSDTQNASAELSRMAAELQSLVGQFKYSSE